MGRVVYARAWLWINVAGIETGRARDRRGSESGVGIVSSSNGAQNSSSSVARERPTMQLDLISPRGEDPARVAAKGRITAMDLASTGRNPIAELLGPNWSAKRLMIDLSQTDYVDSSAIGWLIQTNGEFKRNGGALVLHSIPPMVKQVLSLLKIGSLIPIKDNETAARAHLSGVVVATPAGAGSTAGASTAAAAAAKTNTGTGGA